MRHLLTLTLAQPPLFSFKECLWFLDRGYDDCLYRIHEGSISKPLVLANGEVIIVQVSELGSSLKVAVLGQDSERIESSTQEIIDYVKEWFDMDRDIAPFYQLLGQHRLLHFMPERYAGFRLIGIRSLLEALCWCVIGQQINLSFAHRVKRNLVTTYGTPIETDDYTYHLSPSAEVLAGLSREDLWPLKFSRQKSDYIIGIARLMAEGKLSRKQLEALPTFEDRKKALLEIKGIGAWTANYVLMKSFAEMRCITYGDTGLNQALKSIAGIGPKPKKEEIDTFFAPFVGWESYLVFYLWRTLS